MWRAEQKADIWGTQTFIQCASNFLFLRSNGAQSFLLRVRPAGQTGARVTVLQSLGPD